jgi:hypothetical protein
VLDPAGRPVPNATTMVYARNKSLGNSPTFDKLKPIPIGDACADGSGRFRLDAPRTSSARYDILGAVSIAPGYGVGCVELDPDVDQPAADIMLQPEHVIHGRLFDVQGRPVPDVTMSVSEVRPVVLSPSRSLALARFEGTVTFWWTNANDFPAWPRPATTDVEGRFTMRGVGRNMRVFLTARHPRFALQEVEVETDDSAESKPITLALAPAKIIKGRVTYGDTGKPVPHAMLAVQPMIRSIKDPFSFFETDAEGRFAMNPRSGDRYSISAWPPAGQPYLILSRRLEWPKGALEQSLDLALPRGVAIHGKATEEGSGEPIEGATLRFVARAPQQDRSVSRIAHASTAADGSFQFGALPDSGTLFVMGPSDDYVLQAFDQRTRPDGRPVGTLSYSHANMLLDLKSGVDKEVHVTLRRSMTVKGQVLGPDGQPIRDAWILSQIIMMPRGGSRSWHGGYHDTSARDGHFQIHGLAPDASVPVHFLDPKRKLGATAVFSGKSAAAGPVSVRLEPCGSARARIVDAAGKPFAGRLPLRTLTMVVTPVQPFPLVKEKSSSVAISAHDLNWIDKINYENPVASDADGRVALPVLIPGATYRFTDHASPIRPGVLRKEFTVKPGETLDLGDILIEKPDA